MSNQWVDPRNYLKLTTVTYPRGIVRHFGDLEITFQCHTEPESHVACKFQ